MYVLNLCIVVKSGNVVAVKASKINMQILKLYLIFSHKNVKTLNKLNFMVLNRQNDYFFICEKFIYVYDT